MLELLRGWLARSQAMPDGIGDGVRMQQTYSNQYQHLDRTVSKANQALQGATTTEQRQDTLLELRDTLEGDSIRDAGYLKSALQDVSALIEQGTPESLDKATKYLLGVVADQKKMLTEKVEALRDPAKAREMARRDTFDLDGAQAELQEATKKARDFISKNAGRLDAPDVQRQIRKNAEEINALKSWVAEKGLDAAESTHISEASTFDREGEALRDVLKAIGIDDLDVTRGLKTAQKKLGLPETGQLDKATHAKLLDQLLLEGSDHAFPSLMTAARREDWFRPVDMKVTANNAVVNGAEGIRYALASGRGRESVDLNGTKYLLHKSPPLVDPDPGKPRPMTTADAKELLGRLSDLGEQLARVVGDPTTPPKDKAAAEQALEQIKKLRKAVPPGLLIEL